MLELVIFSLEYKTVDISHLKEEELVLACNFTGFSLWAPALLMLEGGRISWQWEHVKKRVFISAEQEANWKKWEEHGRASPVHLGVCISCFLSTQVGDQAKSPQCLHRGGPMTQWQPFIPSTTWHYNRIQQSTAWKWVLMGTQSHWFPDLTLPAS